MNETIRTSAQTGVAAALLCILAACGGGGGGGESVTPQAPPIATAADGLFPVDATARWAYSTTAGASTVLTRVASVQVSGSNTVAALRVVDPNEASDDTTSYTVGSGGVRLSSAADADPLVRALDGIEILRWPVRANDTWNQYDGTVSAGEDFDADGRIDTVTQHAETLVVGSETVTTPAGTFERCLHQRQTLRQTANLSSGRPPVTVTTVIDAWYAPNVGNVKTTYTTTSAGTPAQTTTESLSAWRIGTRGTDTVAPTVASVTPTATAQGTTGAVSATLDEAIDALSVNGATLTVVDSSGASVPGTVQIEGRTVRFLASLAWAGGRYTARLDTSVTDLLGNPLAVARTWSFDIDASAPVVASTTPGANAEDVALDASIVFNFNEPVSAASVSAGNFSLSDGFASVPVAVTVDGAAVTVRPTVALQRARAYTLTASAIADAYGNTMSVPYTLAFKTTQGRFGNARTLADGYLGSTSAVGDVNGDGIADVVMVGQRSDFSGGTVLLLLAGRADGTLAAPVALPLGSNWACVSIDTVALGDFNGDGRVDVAFGTNNCGAAVLLQGANGQLSTTAFVLGGRVNALAAADLDGDGRTDLVGAGNAGEGYVWRQDGGGRLVLSERPGLFSSARQVAIGDVNGDGRPDLVVALEGTSGLDVAVMLQQPAFFAAPQYLSTQLSGGAKSVALGDVNGDGRIDIVATPGGESPTSLTVFYQSANGTPGPATAVASNFSPSAVVVTDVDGDGRADIVVAHGARGSVGVYLQRAGGTLDAETLYAVTVTGGSQSLTVADISRDGRPDVLADGQWLLQKPTAVGASGATPGRAGIAGIARSLRAAATR